MPEMTPLEAEKLADELEKQLPQKVSYANLVGAESCYGDTYVWEDPEPYMIAEAIQFLRAIAAGEYKRVVRGRWKRQYKSGVIVSSGFVCSACDCWGGERETGFCPRCGALMDGGKNNG